MIKVIQSKFHGQGVVSQHKTLKRAFTECARYNRQHAKECTCGGYGVLANKNYYRVEQNGNARLITDDFEYD